MRLQRFARNRQSTTTTPKKGHGRRCAFVYMRGLGRMSTDGMATKTAGDTHCWSPAIARYDHIYALLRAGSHGIPHRAATSRICIGGALCVHGRPPRAKGGHGRRHLGLSKNLKWPWALRASFHTVINDRGRPRAAVVATIWLRVTMFHVVGQAPWILDSHRHAARIGT